MKITPFAFPVVIFFLALTAQGKNKLFTRGALLVPQINRLNGPQTENTKLNYYGGPIISQVKVVPVVWSSRVSSEIQNSVNDFYSTYVVSKHMDWLSEYNTDIKAIDGRQGTNQKLVRGQSVPKILIQPQQSSTSVTDADIQNEIEKQVDSGILPKPDNNTVYMIHFPVDVQITIEGMTSCFSFGGYHNGVKNKKYGDLLYAVLPECSYLLDATATLDSATFVASHELVEAITDAFPTAGSSPAFPQAWNDSGGNEIADLCLNETARLVGRQRDYSISLEWSNSRNKCYDGE